VKEYHTVPELKRHLAIGLILCTVAAASFDYTVQRGDTLTRVAQQHGTSVRALVEANQLANPNLIRPGQVLVIPGGSSGTSGGSSGGSDAAATSYVIQPGDTLGRIAARFGVSVAALAAANQIPNPNLIHVGRSITIDGGSTSGSTSGGSTPPSLSSRTWVAPGAGEVASKAHTVVPGETIGRIAGAYGVTISNLVDANGLANPNLIRPGQVLVVPLGVGWVCPLPNGTFGNDWGAPRSGGRLHRGNDIFAPRGTPVLAPVAGVVTYQTGSLAGLQFTLAGDDGHRYFGTHLSDRGASGRVVAGEVIGFVGNTGNAAGTPPHLHFETHVDGTEPVNPWHTLMAACG